MEEKNTGFSGLSVSKVANIFYKQDPMAQVTAILKKLKKNKKTKPSEVVEMYNEKCLSLCDTIETNKLEIENYKTIIFGLQKSLIEKEKEVEKMKLDQLKEKENKAREKRKSVELTNLILNNSNIINVEKGGNGPEKREDILQKLQNKIILLNKEKNEFNIRMIELENDYKAILKEKDEKIKELMDQINNQENANNNDNKINENTNEINEEKSPSTKINDEVTEVEIPKQETEEHKLMNYNKILIENLFMNYLLERSANFEKIVRELLNNFDKYSTYFIRDNLKVNNIFSSVMYEFLYRCYRRADLDDFVEEIYDNNTISRSEDFKSKILENEFYTKGYVSEYHINELNKKIKAYKIETFNNIKKLVTKCHEFIKDTPQLENIRKFEPSSLYSFNKSRLKINLTYLNPNSIGYLVTGIKYITDKIKAVDFIGELNYDRNEECKYLHEVFYQLVISHGDEIKELSFNSIKKFSPYKLLSLSYSTNIFIKGINILLQGCPKIKNVFVNGCEITDDHLSDFEFQSNYKYSIINFSNNKIYKLKSFEKIVTTQLILNHNKIRFYQGDNSMSCTYLDISSNDISLKDFNKYMCDSKIQILNLSEIRIAKEDEGNLVANTLSTMRDLKILYLNGCQLQERSLKPILNIFHKSDILEIYLSNNPLGDECMKIISDFIAQCPTLLKIDLGNTKITADGLQLLVEGVTDNESIKEINAENNPMLNKIKAVELFNFKKNFKVNV